MNYKTDHHSPWVRSASAPIVWRQVISDKSGDVYSFNAYSSILGGSGNSDGGFNNVFIAGNGITAVAASTLYVNCVNANSTPFVPGGGSLPSGAIYWDTPGAAGRALYIVP